MRVVPILALAAVIATATAAGPAVAAVTGGDPAEMVLVRGGGGGGGFHGGGFHGGGFRGGDFHGGGFRGGLHHGGGFYHGYGYGVLPGYAYACPYPAYAYPLLHLSLRVLTPLGISPVSLFVRRMNREANQHKNCKIKVETVGDTSRR